MASEKAYEIKMRHWAKRLGLELHKSRNIFWRVEDHREYQVTDQAGKVMCGEKFDMDLDAVGKFLEDYQKKLSNP